MRYRGCVDTCDQSLDKRRALGVLQRVADAAEYAMVQGRNECGNELAFFAREGRWSEHDVVPEFDHSSIATQVVLEYLREPGSVVQEAEKSHLGNLLTSLKPRTVGASIFSFEA